jgi:hypothetical protein
MPVISITKQTHSKLKDTCKDKGLKLSYAAEQAVLKYLSVPKGGSTKAVQKPADG